MELQPIVAVKRSTTLAEVVEVLRESPFVTITGHGSRSGRRVLDACQDVGQREVIDRSGFTRQFHHRVAETDNTLSRGRRGAQPWRLEVRPLQDDTLNYVGVKTDGVRELEDGVGREYVYF